MAAGKRELGLLIAVCMVGVSLGAEKGACPIDTVTARAKACVASTGLDLQAGNLQSLTSNLELSQDLCTNNKLVKAVTCLEELFDVCVNEMNAITELSMQFSVEDWKIAAKTLCDNIDLIQDNRECITKDEQSKTICVKAKTAAFKGELHSKQLEMGKNLNQNDIMAIACSFGNEILKCVKKPLKKNCPKKVSSVFSTVYRHLLPPACQPDDPGYGTVTDEVKDTDPKGSAPISKISFPFFVTLSAIALLFMSL